MTRQIKISKPGMYDEAAQRCLSQKNHYLPWQTSRYSVSDDFLSGD